MAREMKDSGIEWIGKVPTDWHYIKLKTFYNFEKGKNAQRYTIDYIGQNKGTIPVYSGQTENNGIMGFVKDCDYEVSECLFTTTVGAKVMTPRILSGKFCLSQNCLIMKQIKTCNNHFFYYSLLPLFDNEKASIPSYMQPSLRINDLNKYGFFVPSLDTQNNIASFLDSKCAEIDKAIEATKASIEEYRKLRQVIITEAVTAEDIPRQKFKYCAIVKANLVHPEDYQEMYQIAPDNIEKDTGRILFDSVKSVKECGVISDNHLFYKGQILYSKIRPILNKVTIAPFDGLCCADMYPIETNNNTKYLVYSMLSADFLRQVKAITEERVKMPKINQEELGGIIIGVPSKTKQEEIVSFLDAKCSEIDSLIKSKEKLIEELTAYRKSLIYEYVTGKKEVPAV